MRKIPKQFTEGGDKNNAPKAWLAGYDAAMREPLHHCEHCGPIKEQVYKRQGTSWCKACLEALD